MSERGNEGAPPAQPEEGRRRGGLPWGRILAVIIGLVLLALVVPLACQALTGGSGNGGDAGGGAGDGAGGPEETTRAERDGDESAGAGSGTTAPETTGPEKETTGTAGQQAADDSETTTTEDAVGASGEANGGASDEQAGAASDGAVAAGFGATAGGAVGQVGDQGSALDQTGDGTVVIIPQANISGTGGWVSVHRDDGGQPAALIGAAALQEGPNAEVVVPLEERVDTSQRLHAMIHAEDPADGAFTFPDGDPPVEREGEPVVESFRYTAGPMAAGEPMPDTGGPALLLVVSGVVLTGGFLMMLGGMMLRRRVTTRSRRPEKIGR